MALTLDPEVAAGMQKLFGGAPPPAKPPVGDWQTRRATMEGFVSVLGALSPRPDDVSYDTRTLTLPDGHPLALRWYTKDGAQPGSAALYIHGGGMIGCNVPAYDGIIARYVSSTGVPMLAVEYRLAPEHPHPTPVEDCYAAARWLAEHARELGVEPARIAVMGDSAGGGLAAGTALLARDRNGPSLAKQILVYPMLDDRNTIPDAELVPHAMWSYDDNITGWGALLGESHGKDVSPYAAPARATDLSGLPPSYVEVGQLDIFRDEDIHFAHRLMLAGVPTELHVHPGAPHGFEGVAPGSSVARRALADRGRALQSL